MINQAMGVYPIPPNTSIEDYFASYTESCSIKWIASTLLKPCFRAGPLTVLEAIKFEQEISSFFMDAVDIYFLKFAARFLRPVTFDNMVKKRNSEGICGYPLCCTMLKNSDGQFVMRPKEINHSNNNNNNNEMVNKSAMANHEGTGSEKSELDKYCSIKHAKAANFYRSQLSASVLTLRPHIAFYAYGKLPYESYTAVLEEIEIIARMKQMSMQEATVQFAKNVTQASSVGDLSGQEHKQEQGQEESYEGQEKNNQDFENLVAKLQSISID